MGPNHPCIKSKPTQYFSLGHTAGTKILPRVFSIKNLIWPPDPRLGQFVDILTTNMQLWDFRQWVQNTCWICNSFLFSKYFWGYLEAMLAESICEASCLSSLVYILVAWSLKINNFYRYCNLLKKYLLVLPETTRPVCWSHSWDSHWISSSHFLTSAAHQEFPAPPQLNYLGQEYLFSWHLSILQTLFAFLWRT